jgi:iron(III) transport system substrate-binding protein
MSGEKQQKKDRGWRDDEFARHEVFAQWWWLVVPVIGLLGVLVASTFSWFKREPKSEVIIYAAQDQVYAEPILREFEQETGIKVQTVFDSEAVKTTAIVNRLLAERDHPQCDVFWGNEEMRTRQLAAQNVFRETNGWAAFGYRSRRIVINPNFVSIGRAELPLGQDAQQRMPTAPKSMLELTNEIWRGKVALAFPQFGTTATHFHALKQLWGEERWLAWCRALAANKPFIVDGNSVVVKFVARSEAWIGLTDSDDIAAAQREGSPIAAMPLTPSLSPSDGERVAEGRVRGEMLIIPNTVGVIRNAPHPVNAQKLFEYLQRREVAEKLVAAHALEDATNGTHATNATPDWDALLRDLEATTKQLNEIFLR